MKFIITEEEKKQIRSLYEQTLLNKTVNLFKDENEKNISKTVRVKSIEKNGDDIFFKVESPDKIKLKQDVESSSFAKLYKDLNLDYKVEEKEFEVIYKIMCNYGQYDKGKISPIFTEIVMGIELNGYDESLRKSGYPKYYFNKSFSNTLHNQYCKVGSKPTSDFNP